MLDASDILDKLVAVLLTNTSLNPFLDPAKVAANSAVFASYHIDPAGTNFEQKIQEQPRGTIMVGWRATRTGTFGRNEVTKHDFTAYLRPIAGRATTCFAAFMNGTCTVPAEPPFGAQSRKFRLLTIDQKCLPPTEIELIPVPILIGAKLAIFDVLPVNFTMIEKGLDV